MKTRIKNGLPVRICIFFLLILFMSSYAFAAEVDIKVIDEITKNPLEGVKAEIDQKDKKTNEKGIVVFNIVENKTHILTLEKEGYRQTTKEINATSEKNKTIKLKRDDNARARSFDPEDKPIVTIKNLENKTIVENDSLEIEFSVETNLDIKRCVFLSQGWKQHGYTIKDSLEKIEEGKHTLSALFGNNGDFIIRIMCENLAGQGYSKGYSIKAKGFSKDELSINEKNNKEDESDENKKIEKPSIVKEIETIKDILDGSALNSFQRNNEGLIDLLGFKNIKREGKKDLEELKQRRIDLEGLNMGQSDYEEHKREISSEFRKLKSEIPKEIEIIDEHKFLLPVTFEETNQALQTYLSNRRNEEDISQYKNTIEQSRRKQDNISIYSTITQVRVHYLDDGKEEFTRVKKEIDGGGISQGFFMEIMPEGIVDSLSDIEFSNKYESIDGLTTIRFSHEHENFSYLIKGAKDSTIMGDAKTVYLLEPTKDRNIITGLFISAQEVETNTAFILAIFIVSIMSAGLITYKSGFAIQRPLLSNYREEKITSQKEPECALLLKRAIDHIKTGNDIEAIKLYPAILNNYKKLGPKSKKELQPIIAYISDVSELQYLFSLINKACDQMELGTVESELVKEIDQCYHSLSESQAKKIQQKYNWYRSLLDLKLQRKDEQVKQIIFREKRGEELSHGVDDTLFGK